MTSDDLFESESYFNRKFDPDKAEARERLKAKRELKAQPEITPSLNRRKLLLRIATDTAEPYSVRMDAKRLLEVADLRPHDFDREYEDFISWHKETTTL